MKKDNDVIISLDKWKYAELPKIKPFNKKIDFHNMISLGSCFARNFTRWLFFARLNNKRMPWDILYNPFSMSMEIVRLFEEIDWQKGIIYENGLLPQNNRIRDPWRSWTSFESISQLKHFNHNFSDLAKREIDQASGFLFTFGLSEIWCNNKNHEIIANQLPSSIIFGNKRGWKSRFASVDEIEGAIKRMIGIIRKNYVDKMPIIFTLSPVPLKYTFSGLSVREANNISKSTILITLNKVINNEENIYYFPVYEIVQALVEQKFPVWQSDGRHITAATIDYISRLLIDNYGSKNKFHESLSDFWVPFVDSNGVISGRLFVNGEFST